MPRNTTILRLEYVIWNPSTIKYGDYYIIVRQPCLWTGSINPFRVKLTLAEMDFSVTWDVNASMIFPITMCTPFGANYDGDEMAIFIVKDPNSISECKSFKWYYSDTSPCNLDRSETVVPLLVQKEEIDTDYEAACTAICCSDTERHIIITPVHSKWMDK